MSVAGGTLFAGVDRAVLAAAFVARLRSAGLEPALVSTNRFAAALDVADPRSIRELYWTARTTLVDDVAQLPVFDAVFAAVFEQWFGGRDTAPRRPHDLPAPRSTPDEEVAVPVRGDDRARLPGGGGVPWATAPSAASQDDAGDDGSVVAEPSPSHLAHVARTPFDRLDERELTVVAAELERLAGAWPARRSRRHRRARTGRTLDRRRTLRAALRTGGEPLRLRHAERVPRPRRIVVLADVSGSMQTWTRAYLHVVRALGRRVGAEAFAFATEVTRITAALRHRSPQEAVAHASELVEDRFGGTRIATSIGRLQRDPAWSTLLRGAVVIVISDGADTDPAEQLAGRMARLHRLAHRVVWVNPRGAAPGYEPRVGGMAAALPFCDEVVTGHTLAAVRELFETLATTR